MSIHYNISLYLLTPKIHIKPLAFYFPFQFRTSFSPKSLQAISWAQHLFSDPCKRWRLYNGLSYFQSNRSRLANSTTYNCSCQFSKIILGSKIHFKVQYDHQIQPSVHTCVTELLSMWWQMQTEFESSNEPKLWCQQHPVPIVVLLLQKREKNKWAKLNFVTSRVSSALTPVPWQRQKDGKKDLQIQTH